MRDGQQFLVFVGVCVLQVTLACESIVLYMCEGKVLMDMKRPQFNPFHQEVNYITIINCRESVNNIFQTS